MKATTLLLAQHRRIQELVDHAAHDELHRDERTIELIEAVAMHIATEENIVYPEVERQLGLDLAANRAAHVRARLALFRFATAPLRASAYHAHLASLDRAMRDHALGESRVVRALEDEVSEPALRRLGERMHEFQRDHHVRPIFIDCRNAALAS